jgi:hypothetical protein
MIMNNNSTKSARIAAVRAMNNMTVEELTSKIGNNLEVTVTFYKRGDASLRVCRCTRNWDFLKKNGIITNFIAPKGVGLPYCNTSKGLVSAWDIENEHWVQIPANSTMSVK